MLVRLQPGVAGIHGVHAVALDLGRDRALEHVDHLEFGLVQMLLRHDLGIALADEADDMGERHAVGGVLDAEIAVVRVGAQAVGLEVLRARDGSPRTCAGAAPARRVAAPSRSRRPRRASWRTSDFFARALTCFVLALAMVAPPLIWRSCCLGPSRRQASAGSFSPAASVRSLARRRRDEGNPLPPARRARGAALGGRAARRARPRRGAHPAHRGGAQLPRHTGAARPARGEVVSVRASAPKAPA